MGLHIYCIVPAGHPVPDDCFGIDARRPFIVNAGRLAAWATEHDTRPVPSIAAIRSHNDVVSAAMTPRVTPVPMRFGQWFADREGAAEVIEQEEAKWTDLLKRFAGRAEYGVRALRPEPDAERDVRPAAPQSGRQFMAALAHRQAQAADRREEGERIAAAIAARLSGLIEDRRAEFGGGDTLLVTLAHLVAWTAADAYHGGMSEVRATAQDTRFVLTGPWAPWSFVE
ncbi:MAG: GvpL/GvpF family gas vesicle protein [Longimicrobiales bacterium]